MLVVTAGIICSKNKILIARRAPGKHLGGLWELPGGKLEEGESAEECLSRELKEELGITVDVGNFFMENQHQYGDRTILLKAYLCDLVSGDVILNDHDQVEWVSISEFEKYTFAPADIPFIKALVDGQ
jgi:8-oxo-dGTP diphosphatase